MGTYSDLKPPIEIVNAYSDGSFACKNMNGFYGKEVVSGSTTADTYPGTAQISITGSGVIEGLAVWMKDTTSRTLGALLVIDGEPAFDAVSNANTSQYYGFVIAGDHYYATGACGKSNSQYSFNSSAQLYMKTSLTETDGMSALIRYYLT